MESDWQIFQPEILPRCWTDLVSSQSRYGNISFDEIILKTNICPGQAGRSGAPESAAAERHVQDGKQPGDGDGRGEGGRVQRDQGRDHQQHQLLSHQPQEWGMETAHISSTCGVLQLW